MLPVFHSRPWTGVRLPICRAHFLRPQGSQLRDFHCENQRLPPAAPVRK